MSGWKELLIDILKLTDEVKRLNREVELSAYRTT
jgi:hypothetical protein